MSVTSPKEDKASCSSVAKQFTYIDLVEKCTLGECFAFSDDPNIRKEIDSALMKIAYISLQYKKNKGRARKELEERVRKIHVMEGQAKTIQEFYNKMESLHDEIGILHDELQEWKSRCKNLEEEKERKGFQFSILQTAESVMSAKGNKTVGIVSGTEGYQTIKVSFGSLFKEINSLIESAKLTVDGQELNTEFYVGRGYKFILLMLGLKGATSTCAWCKVHKADCLNISDNYLIYNTPPIETTLEEICEMLTTSKDNYCCDKQPLLNIPLDHIPLVVDELHFMLCVTDIPIENLVNECLHWDHEDDLDNTKGAHLKNLTQVI